MTGWDIWGKYEGLRVARCNGMAGLSRDRAPFIEERSGPDMDHQTEIGPWFRS